MADRSGQLRQQDGISYMGDTHHHLRLGVDFFTHYFNNDFTEIANQHTIAMRTEKRRLTDPTYADSFEEDDGSRVIDDEEDDEIEAVEEGDEND